MKVCHLTSVHNSFDTRIFYKECVSLARAGNEVYLVAPGESRKESGVQVLGVGEMPRSRIRRITVIASKVFQAATNLECDVYHLHDPELLMYAKKLLRKGKKVVFDCHEDIFEYVQEKQWIPAYLRKATNYVASKYFRRILPKLDRLISVTPHLHEDLLKINRRTTMITNYPILDNQHFMNFQKKKLGVFRLVFAGGVTHQWSHVEIVKALQQTEGVVYNVYGKANEEYLKKVLQEDSHSRMNYCGPIPFTKVQMVLQSSSVGMALCKYSRNTAGRRGSLGNTKLFEFMLAGLPVICTDFDLWKDIIDRYQCGICVDPEKSDDLIKAIVYLRDNPIIAVKMGENGRKAAQEEYNWKTQEKKLLELYAELDE